MPRRRWPILVPRGDGIFDQMAFISTRLAMCTWAISWPSASRRRFVDSEQEQEAVHEVRKTQHANQQSHKPYSLLTAQCGHGRQSNADLKHRHGIGKAMVMF